MINFVLDLPGTTWLYAIFPRLSRDIINPIYQVCQGCRVQAQVKVENWTTYSGDTDSPIVLVLTGRRGGGIGRRKGPKILQEEDVNLFR
jgi:hypothetical protein